MAFGEEKDYSDEQVAQALRESMAQGFTLEQSLGGASEKFGVSQDQLARARQLIEPAQKTVQPAAQQVVDQPDNAAALTGLYKDVFKRDPDKEGFQFWLNAMNTQGYTPEMVRAEFLKSAEAKAKPDVVSALQTAGLQEQKPDINQLLYGQQKGAAPAAVAPDPTKPRDMIKSLMLDPEALQNLTLARQQAYDQGEASTYVNTGMDIGGFNVKQVPEGYIALKKDVAPETDQLKQMGLSGRPMETVYTYDAEGNVTGTEQRYFKGSDSGIVVRLDAEGNPIDARPFDYSESWKGDVLPIANIALTALAGPAAGKLTTALTPTIGAALAPVAAQGIVGAGRGAILGGLTGQDVGSSAFKGAVSGAAGAGLGKLTDIAGKEVGKLVGPMLPAGQVGDFLQNAAVEVTKGLTTELGKAAVGSVLTGRPLDLGTAASAGALSGLSQAAMTSINEAFGKDPLIKDLPKPLKDAAFAAVAAELRGRDPGQAALNSLVKQVGRSIFNAAKAGSVTAQLTGAGLQEGEPSSIWEGWDPSGGEGVSGAPQRLEITEGKAGDTGEGLDLIQDLFQTKVTPKITLPQQTVGVTGSKLQTGDKFLDDLLEDIFVASQPTEKVDVTGKKLAGESVEVTGKKIPPDQSVDVVGKKIPVDETVDVVGKKIPADETVDVVGKKIKDDIQDQVVDVVDKKTVDTDTTTPVTPPTTTPRPGGGGRGGGASPVAAEPRRFQPMAEPQGDVFRPGLANVFYAGALGFGPEGQSMADPTDFQGRMTQARRSMELAIEGEGGENASEDAYERLMAMAEERPAATIDELMRIIERG